jgi:peptide/nickel transport system permease protein
MAKAEIVSDPNIAMQGLARESRAVVSPGGSGGRRTWRRFWRNQSAVFGLVIVTLVAALALFAPWIAPHDPNEQFPGKKFAPPSANFPLGADGLGRDMMSRLVYGAQPSVGSAALATILIAAIGVTLGVLAGYRGGWVDDVIMRLVDTLLALPSLLLAIAIVGVLGPSLLNVILGAVLIWWASYARLVRSLVLEVRERPYIEAAVTVGVGTPRLIWRHLLPNIIAPVIVLASLEMGTLLLIIAGLNFLGLGVQPPTAEWGAMLNQGRAYFQLAPEQMLYPGSMITITVLGFNLLGDGLRDILDPRHYR